LLHRDFVQAEKRTFAPALQMQTSPLFCTRQDFRKAGSLDYVEAD
jgi:hypothetical protein